MTTHALLIGLLFAFALACTACQPGPPSPAAAGEPAGGPATADGRTLSRPFTHDNLTVFFVRGPETAKGQRFLTLQEALEQKKIVVHETGTVNELAVENLSDEQVFIQAGDIVRGGKQDRMFGNDLIVEARSGKVPITTYCVEQGRWQRRGAESAERFASSPCAAPDNRVKLAAKMSRNQSAVWSGVADAQKRLGSSLGSNVVSSQSSSSLQLTLENEAVRRSTDDFVKALSGSANDLPDAIGVVVLINGKPYSADVYGTRELFRQLWPKLLHAGAVEAIAAKPASKESIQPSAAAADRFLRDAAAATADESAVSARIKIATRQTVEIAQFDTIDAKSAGKSVHQNCLRKDTPPPQQPKGSVPPRR